MNTNRNLLTLSNFILRKYGTKIKPKITTSQNVLQNIEDELYKPRRHPGISTIKTVTMPESIVGAIENVIVEFPIKTILHDSIGMCLHLKGRVSPMEPEEIKQTKNNIYEQVVLKESANVNINSQQDEVKFKQKVKDKVIKILKEKVYNWSPMTYDSYNSLVYLIGRGPAEYAALVKIFSEISNRDQDFKPRSMFDFGSGVGTASWAAKLFWNKYIFEYFNVDTSSFMNDLAQIILQDGHGTNNASPNLKGVYYRQFLPANNVSYDLVVSAYTLLEMPSFQMRMQTILKLWNKTERYLVIIEQGTNAGFRIINEARDFIIEIEDKANKGHVFSPCPHDSACPRFLHDNTPCNFEVAYNTLPIGAKPEYRKELYTYVVLKKGIRDPNDLQWPRAVRDTLIRSKHVICRFCTANAKLEEIIFSTAKHGKATYHCARYTKWGDRLPITIEKVTEDVEKTETRNTTATETEDELSKCVK